MSSAPGPEKTGALLGAVVMGALLGLPYFHGFAAAKSGLQRDTKRALVSSTVLLGISLVVVVGCIFVPDGKGLSAIFGVLVWSAPALLNVRGFSS